LSSDTVLLRRLLGDELRRRRIRQGRTLREVSSTARVSLGYLSEIERGQKEASSELLAAVCGALEVPLSQVLRGVSDELELREEAAVRVPAGARPEVPVSALLSVPTVTIPARARDVVAAA
jgi:transcriptional regulator with XRE-family HTH domain